MPIVLVLFFVFNTNNMFGQTWKAGTNSVYVDPSDNNVAIGINKAETALHIHREINFATDPYSVIRLSINDVKSETHVWDIGNYDNLHFKFGFGSSTETKMILTPLGQLALGTESPAASAIMQLESTDKGLLLPRLSTLEKEAINSPTNGLLVYDTDLQTLSFYDAGIWKQISISSTFSDYLTITNFNNSPAGGITNSNITNWNTAHTWGNHATAGYLTSFIETDPVFNAWDKTTGITITESQITDFGTYLTDYTETDPVYSANFDVSNATSGDLLQYNGSKFIKFTPDYLTSYTEIDPIFNAWDKNYDDLTNKPSLFDGQWSNLSGTLPNISIFPNDAGYITEANISNFWIREKENTVLLNENESSRQAEFHRKPLTEPYVTVSRHTALLIQI